MVGVQDHTVKNLKWKIRQTNNFWRSNISLSEREPNEINIHGRQHRHVYVDIYLRMITREELSDLLIDITKT